MKEENIVFWNYYSEHNRKIFMIYRIIGQNFIIKFFIAGGFEINIQPLLNKSELDKPSIN